MKSTYVWTVVAVLVVLGGAFWYISAHPNAPSVAEAGVIHQKGDIYTIDLAFPTSTPLVATLGQAADQAAVSAMKDWLSSGPLAEFTGGVEEAQKMVADFKSKGEEVPASFQNLTLNTSYKEYTGVHTISYVFTTSEFTGGAHPNSTTKTFTFETQSGTVVTLADIMTGAYLKTLSVKSRAYLLPHIAAAQNTPESQVNKEMLNAGTAPDPENFSNFYIDVDSITFIFPPYQVGPYVLGTQTYTTPLINLKDVVKPAYR